jgi:glycosidase
MEAFDMRATWLACALVMIVLTACGKAGGDQPSAPTDVLTATVTEATPLTSTPASTAAVPLQGDSWWKDAVIYEIFVRSFYDSNGDGIGDFNGLISKLDYLNDGNPETTDDLGITGIWLMPIHPTTTTHGYDVIDYRAVNPEYGTMGDFRRLVTEAHRRGIRILIDLVLNHTSSQNPWFLQSQNPQSPFRDWYVWSESDPGFLGPWNQQVWYQTSSGYYYAYFWEGMPDLNYTNPDVTAEMEDVTRFWLEDVGIDGFRLDAIGVLIEDGSTVVETPATHEWLRKYNAFVHDLRPDALVTGEVWQNDSVVAPYILNDEVDLAFEFDLSSSILASVNAGNAASILDTLRVGTSQFPPGQYGTFLTNHDMTRVMTQLGSNEGKARVAASLLLMLPGVPFIYYGEEIGTVGEAPDAMGRRPMQWSPGLQAGFSATTAWMPPDSRFPSTNVAAQADDPASLLSRYRRLIAMRAQHPALRSPNMDVVTCSNPGVFASLRTSQDEAVMVIINLTDRQIGDALLSVASSALTEGRYVTRSLMLPTLYTELEVNAAGGFEGYSLGPDLTPYATLLVELKRR